MTARKIFGGSLPALLVCFCLAPALDAQGSFAFRAGTGSDAPSAESVKLRVEKNLVLIPVAVEDGSNRPVTTFQKENFRVFDNKVEQTITQFAVDDQPMAIGLVFDTSASLQFRLDISRAAAHSFLQAAHPEDEFFLVMFSTRPELVVPFTTNTGLIESRLAATEPKGYTALLDAVDLAVHQVKTSKKPRKALLLISDGQDNGSRRRASEIQKLLRESDVLIYSIGIYQEWNVDSRSHDALFGRGLLKEIAEETGAREFAIGDVKELPDMAAKIGKELRSRYLLGYSPAGQPSGGRYHRVQVKVVPPTGMSKLRVHWRLGYFEPQS